MTHFRPTLRRYRVIALAVGLLSVPLLAWFDHATGTDLSFSIFYLLPISLVAWYAGRLPAVVVSLASGLAWLAVDLMQVRHEQPWIPYWNAGVRLGFFMVVGILLAAWHNAAVHLQELLDARTADLSSQIAKRQQTERELAESEDRFRQAQKMEAIGRLAGGVAHDFRNQMTVVRGYCELSMPCLAEGHPVREHLDHIRTACDRATRLTSQLLAFSRREILRPDVINVNRIIGEMEGPLAQMIGEDSRLAVLQAENAGNVSVDVLLLEQAVMNLVINGRDAMPNGGKLTIETANVVLDEAYARQHPEVRPGPHVMLAVSDAGSGMTDEVKRHLFEPFFTTKPAGSGTGLGLPMVYGFVKQSGGHISVYSEPGRGTTVKLYFPRVFEPEQVAAQVPAAPAMGGSETVLVVDDDRAIREITATMLKQLGYDAILADGAAEGLRLARKHAPVHLLITDVIMPETSGPELARQLTAEQPGMKVVYVTGYAENAIVHHGVVDRGVNLITKPFGLDGLAQTVRRVLDAT